MKNFFKIFLILLISITISANIGIQANAQPILTNNNTSSVSPLAAIIEWRYKVENGKLYKRLFNYTTEQWVGEWILVS